MSSMGFAMTTVSFGVSARAATEIAAQKRIRRTGNVCMSKASHRKDRMRAHRASSAAQGGNMKTWKIGVAAAGAIGAALLGVSTLLAQQPGFKRTELQKHDLGTPRGEVV